ncbi:MAG: hypothetical protein INR73_28625 [Williamsia sp.]|nr:hypothetical protein [Williamsia sp.]
MSQTHDLHYIYETRCRRCKRLYEWVGPARADMAPRVASDHLQSLLESPRQMSCERCKKTTIHDLVSYN